MSGDPDTIGLAFRLGEKVDRLRRYLHRLGGDDPDAGWWCSDPLYDVLARLRMIEEAIGNKLIQRHRDEVQAFLDRVCSPELEARLREGGATDDYAIQTSSTLGLVARLREGLA